MPDEEPEQIPLNFGPYGGDETIEVAVLTVNQLVAYNLMRARRQKAWTQQETAERLTQLTSKKWTAATLSAAERSWQTGRSRQFDANELAAFASIFDCPIPYFFLPIKPGKDQRIWYALTKVDEAQPFPALKSKELLDAAVPLRYPSNLIDEVNGLRQLEGIAWSPSAHVDWWRPEEHFSPEPPPDETTPDEDPWEAYQEREWRKGLARHDLEKKRISRGQLPSKEFLVNLVMGRLGDSVHEQAEKIVANLLEVWPAIPGEEQPENTQED